MELLVASCVCYDLHKECSALVLRAHAPRAAPLALLERGGDAPVCSSIPIVEAANPLHGSVTKNDGV